MFQAILRVPVLFFDTNPSGKDLYNVMYKKAKYYYGVETYTLGRILNRFSKDVGFLDDLLPYIFCEFILV